MVSEAQSIVKYTLYNIHIVKCAVCCVLDARYLHITHTHTHNGHCVPTYDSAEARTTAVIVPKV